VGISNRRTRIRARCILILLNKEQYIPPQKARTGVKAILQQN
jgi:hypothetical protein